MPRPVPAATPRRQRVRRRPAAAGARTGHPRAGAGRDHADTAFTLHYLALLLADQGEPDAARSSFERALAIGERQLGPDHPDTVATRDGLANLTQASGLTVNAPGAAPVSDREA